MLEPSVGSGLWHRWLLRSALACGATIGAAGAVHWAVEQAAPPPVAVLVPSPIVVPIATPVAAPTPAPAPAPDPPEPPPLPHVVHRACGPDVSLVGVPIGLAPPSSGQRDFWAAATPDGCTLALWTDSALEVSWDGGQTFEHFEGTRIARAAVAADRVIVLTPDAIGVVHAADGALTWHALGAAAPAGPTEKWHLDLAAGWTMLSTDAHDTDAGSDEPPPVAAVSADEGGSWLYVEAPSRAALFTGLTTDGRVEASEVRDLGDGGGVANPTIETTRWRFAMRHPGWHRAGTLLGRVISRAGEAPLALLADQFWGCGGSDKLVAYRGDSPRTLARDLRDATSIDVVAGAHAVYARDTEGSLRQLAGAGAGSGRELAKPDDLQLVGVDGSDTLIAVAGTRLVRWSPRAGWRVLYAPPAVIDD